MQTIITIGRKSLGLCFLFFFSDNLTFSSSTGGTFFSINILDCNPSISVFFSSFFLLFYGSMGVSTDFFGEGFVFFCNLLVSFVRIFITGTCVFSRRFTIYPSSSCVVCFFFAPLFFIWTVGFSYSPIFISLIKKQFLLFFWSLTFPYFFRIICCTSIGLSLLCVHQFLLVKYILWVHMGFFSCISFFYFCFC
ncbi:hypothetical protein HOY80DRAFT_340109 [Tuber brumale]|nr:hypothetical protein HOY80DRAFT_340109 [Tuber brumale]